MTLPELLTAARAAMPAAADYPLVRIHRHLARALCGLRGHEMVLQCEATRVRLRCPACGRETSGWDLSRPPARTESVREARPEPSGVARRVVRQRKMA